ncbi:MAG TPA: TM1802 family CRISPR-associated protein [Thermotogota bacterium]|nr:TM1802 family CRISPR-associated protein [Thermotogota bacterium]
MGFLQAVFNLARKEGDAGNGLSSLLDLPSDPENGRVIRIGLKVSSMSPPYAIAGTGTIDVTDVLPGEITEEEWKARYLFREPASPSAGWRYSPVIKIGAPTTYEKFEESWEKFRKTLSEKTFPDFECKGVLAAGSGEIIISDLEPRKKEIFSYMEKKRSHTLVFGIEENGAFFYPGDLPPFIEYCKTKLGALSAQSEEGVCSICANPMTNAFHLDRIFSFATFDKPGFIPALDPKNIEGVFPICSKCFDTLNHGRAIMDRSYTDTNTLPGYRLWIIPEVMGGGKAEAVVLKQFENYIVERKASGEGTLLRYLTASGESLVFHFVVWQKMQAKELVHLMVEDVSPSWLAVLENKWKAVRKSIFPEESERDMDHLDFLFTFIFYLFSEQNPKSADDKSVLTKTVIEIVARLLNRQRIDTLWLKSLFVSRFPSLMSGGVNPRFSLRKQLMFIEYIAAVNQSVKGFTV